MPQNSAFRKFVSIPAAISLAGCASVRPVETTPQRLQAQIRHEGLLKVGDSARIFTLDEKEHRFVVTAIDADAIRGNDVTIPINSVIAVQTREVSAGKTGLLTDGRTGFLLLLFVSLLPAVLYAAIFI